MNGMFTVVLAVLFCCINSSEASVRLDAHQTRQSLGYETYYLVETERPLSIDEVTSDEMQIAFVRSEDPVPNFGLVNEAHWFRVFVEFDILGQTKDPSVRIITISYPFLDHIELYAKDHTNRFQKYISGDTYPFQKRRMKNHEFAFAVTLKPKQINEFYIRVKTTTSLQLPIEIWTEEAFRNHTSNEKFAYGVFYGALLVMLFYNLFLYFSVRDSNFLNYVYYIATASLASASIDGLAFQYLWPMSPLMANVSIPILANLCVIAAIHFGVNYLNTRSFSPRSYVFSRIIIAASFCAFIPVIIGNNGLAILSSTLLTITMCVFLFSLGAYGILKKQRRAYFFFAAWLLLFVGLSLRSLSVLDVLPTNLITLHAGRIGIALELILLSFGLADRMNQDRQEKYNAIKDSLVASQQTLQANEEKREAAELLIAQSLMDQLTGHPNRLSTKEKLKDCISRCDPSSQNVTLAIIHLGNFQDINNTFGHDVGDNFLKQFIAVLDDAASSADHVIDFENKNVKTHYVSIFEGVYLGIIFVHDKTTSIESEIDSIMQVFEKPVLFNGMSLMLQGQTGLALWPEHGGDAETLIRKAMIAVRSAKWSRTTIQTYKESIDLYSAKRLSLMSELKSAIQNDQLELYFQPKIDLKTKTVIGMEALIRWNHPSQGILGPDKFISLAENTGLIKPLTQWVINKALATLGRFFSKGFNLTVSVNVSARNLLEEDFVDSVNQALLNSSVSANKLIMEVVESEMIEDIELTIQTLARLNDLGLLLSIDDFGTGYSSLEYLKKLPVNELKIDRSFVSDMSDDSDDKLIVSTTLAIAHQLGLHVVAEGIENESTLELLRAMSCDIGQGYYISAPLSEKDFLEFISLSSWKVERRLKAL